MFIKSFPMEDKDPSIIQSNILSADGLDPYTAVADVTKISSMNRPARFRYTRRGNTPTIYHDFDDCLVKNFLPIWLTWVKFYSQHGWKITFIIMVYPFPNFNGAGEVWEWLSDFIPHFDRMLLPIHDTRGPKWNFSRIVLTSSRGLNQYKTL